MKKFCAFVSISLILLMVGACKKAKSSSSSGTLSIRSLALSESDEPRLSAVQCEKPRFVLIRSSLEYLQLERGANVRVVTLSSPEYGKFYWPKYFVWGDNETFSEVFQELAADLDSTTPENIESLRNADSVGALDPTVEACRKIFRKGIKENAGPELIVGKLGISLSSSTGGRGRRLSVGLSLARMQRQGDCYCPVDDPGLKLAEQIRSMRPEESAWQGGRVEWDAVASSGLDFCVPDSRAVMAEGKQLRMCKTPAGIFLGYGHDSLETLHPDNSGDSRFYALGLGRIDFIRGSEIGGFDRHPPVGFERYVANLVLIITKEGELREMNATNGFGTRPQEK